MKKQVLFHLLAILCFSTATRLSAQAQTPPFEVGVMANRSHIKGQYNAHPLEWTQLPKSAQELVSFNPQKYTLLVHAGSNPRKIATLLKNSNTLAEAFSFSASLIDQDHRSTYGSYGVVLAAPPENILATSAVDMGSPFAKAYSAEDIESVKDEEFFYSLLLQKNPVLSPQAVLQSSGKKWNEIMVAGTTTNGGSVNIIGLFVKTKNGSVVANAEIVQQVEQLAQKLGIPILRIEANADDDF